MKHTTLSTLAAAAVLLAGVGSGAALGSLRERQDTGSGQRSVPVQSAELVCPAPLAGSGSTSWVTVAVPPGARPDAGGGPVTVSPIDDERQRVLTASKPGVTAKAYPSGTVPPLVARASGPLAAGLTVEQVTSTDAGEARGLSATPCGPAAADFWFVGTSTLPDRSAVLYLTNPEDSVAEVDVAVYGPEGPIESEAARGITVQPHAQQRLRLDALTGGRSVPALALHVMVRSGRVAAAVRDQEDKNLTGRGVDWIPQTTGPAKTLVIPALPAVDGVQALYLVAQGGDGTARVRLISKDGPYAPAGAESVPVTQDRVSSVNFKLLRGQPVAVLVEAQVPVVAGLRVTRQVGKAAEAAFLAATPPLAGPAVIADARTSSTFTTTLLLTARTADGQVKVTTFGSGQPRTRTVRIPKDTTVTVDLAGPGKATQYAVFVEPQPGSGEIYATRLLQAEKSASFTLLPLLGARYTATIPDVANDMSAGLSPVTEGQ
ncbi:putative secreted protein [Carbonactinospora thermoautotrophica]|uniref:Putative secreted protein n=1 Tax=Carbonactinospora thermoautotrophica TaxID=1469144 RepID=A0A132MWZ6_9ACTN|nr:DUF5719 family protein [Carbonactinospora thermoautotrophica]KWX02344.1 putative secreted protein [Carbonactinospora thermoautotrophica]